MEDLQEVAGVLQAEYTVRRKMLLERLKVTLQVGAEGSLFAAQMGTRN